MFNSVIWLVIGLVSGGVISFFVRKMVVNHKTHVTETRMAQLLSETRDKCKEILLAAKEEAVSVRIEAEADFKDRRSELQRWEKRLSHREDGVDRKFDSVEKREKDVVQKEKEVESIKEQANKTLQEQMLRLELISGMSHAEAKDLLFQKLEAEVREEHAQQFREMEASLTEEADARGREIISSAIQRCAGDVVSESTVSVVAIPSDDMKGRIIGREGRNIRALESTTGVELIIDDTPGAVTLSCFDPVRREIARVALSKLILDGRIHPARIEEVVKKAKGDIEATIQSEGERAAYECGVQGLHPELVKLIGRLKYRLSYGQNVLTHSIEVSHIAGMIASEIGANVRIAKKAGLLHDIGKAMDFEIEGTHAAIGADAVRRWDKDTAVVNAVAEHHEEVPLSSVESFIVAAADAVSGARPGARRESMDHYLKRLEALENVANSFPGVEKSYAIQAGREIRIMVEPEKVDDLGVAKLARGVAAEVEKELQYPGQIKVIVVRETRVIDYAK
ncbi:MAG: ribonuclease Y [Dehalococcoidia bacterium]|nr:ribonuclease Y [Dehalococcoidia bacterium]